MKVLHKQGFPLFFSSISVLDKLKSTIIDSINVPLTRLCNQQIFKQQSKFSFFFKTYCLSKDNERNKKRVYKLKDFNTQTKKTILVKIITAKRKWKRDRERGSVGMLL